MVNVHAVEGVLRTLRSQRLATAANREFCDVSLMTAAQLIPQSDFAELHQDRVAVGRYRPTAPTDPYVRTLAHTVPLIMDSLRA